MKKGFTLIELLVVISIIGLLSSVIFTSLESARSKARDAKRVGDLKSLQTALEIYRAENGSYPIRGSWTGLCSAWNNGTITNTGSTGYIPNLAPKYISILPQDPKPQGSTGCYIYLSDGKDYMILAYYTVENRPIPNALLRKNYPLEPNYAVYTDGFQNQ